MKKILFLSIFAIYAFGSTYAENKFLDLLETYNLKCAKGDDYYCEKLNSIKSNTPLKKPTTKQDLINQCYRGDYETCAKIGEDYFIGRNGFEKDIQKSESFFKLACKGIEKYCNSVKSVKILDELINRSYDYQTNNNYYNGSYTQNKVEYQDYLYECNNGYAKACLEVARGYNKGIYGFPKNINKSIYYAQLACNKNVYEGCEAVRQMTRTLPDKCYRNMLDKRALLAGETFVARNQSNKARECFEIACNKDNSTACKNLGDMYHYGNGAIYNYKTAKAYYAKACNLGDFQACREYKKIDKKINKKPNKREILDY